MWPSTVDTRNATQATVQGRHFCNAVEIQLNDRRAPIVRAGWRIEISEAEAVPLGAERVDDSMLAVALPAGLPVGLHDVRVTNPAGRSRNLPDALAVIDGSKGEDNLGGTAGTAPITGAVDGSAGTSASGSGVAGALQAGGGGGVSGAGAPDGVPTSGAAGASESDGASGFAGSGASGASAGASGEAGSAGSVGTSGSAGFQGTSGAAGSLGGTSGAAGSSGAAGGFEVAGQGGTGSDACSDGLLNRDETGIDCGGAFCQPCDCADAAFSEPEMLLLTDPQWYASDTTYWSPTLSRDGLTLIFAVNYSGNERIYQATREGRDSITFSGTKEVFPTSVYKRGSPALSYDGLTLYFYVDATTSTTAGRGLWRATRDSVEAGFDFGESLSTLHVGWDAYLPWPSRDGLRLYYVAENPAVSNSAEIWMAERSSPQTDFAAGTNVAALNSTGADGRLAMTPDGNVVYFSSNRNDGYDEDLWVAARSESGGFGTPTRVSELNSSEDDKDVTLTADGAELFFVSSRSGEPLIYRCTRTCD